VKVGDLPKRRTAEYQEDFTDIEEFQVKRINVHDGGPSEGNILYPGLLGLTPRIEQNLAPLVLSQRRRGKPQCPVPD
jgi:hypothetical protein